MTVCLLLESTLADAGRRTNECTLGVHYYINENTMDRQFVEITSELVSVRFESGPIWRETPSIPYSSTPASASARSQSPSSTSHFPLPSHDDSMMFLPSFSFRMVLGLSTCTTSKSGRIHCPRCQIRFLTSGHPITLSRAAHQRIDGDGDLHEHLQLPSKAEMNIMQLAQSHFSAQALLATIRIGAFDVLGFDLNGDDYRALSMTVDEIISEIHSFDSDAATINRGALFRCLRLLCSSGVIKEVINEANESAFLLTGTGRLLQRSTTHNSDSPNMSAFVLHWCELPLWNAWSHLPDYVSGKSSNFLLLETSNPFDLTSPPFDRANGMSASEYYKQHPSSCSHRNAVAKYASSKEIKSILDAMQSSSVLNESILAGRTVVDIGGGYGDLANAMKDSMPTIGDWYCLDLPDVIADAISTTLCNNYRDNLVSGNMFDASTIPDCDYIITKHVLCDFSDEDVVRALQTFHTALSSKVGTSGKVVIMDAVLPNGDDLNGKWNAALSYDVLLMLTGRRGERSRVEWSNLAKRAGFVLEDVLSTSSVTVDLAILSLA